MKHVLVVVFLAGLLLPTSARCERWHKAYTTYTPTDEVLAVILSDACMERFKIMVSRVSLCVDKGVAGEFISLEIRARDDFVDPRSIDIKNVSFRALKPGPKQDWREARRLDMFEKGRSELFSNELKGLWIKTHVNSSLTDGKGWIVNIWAPGHPGALVME